MKYLIGGWIEDEKDAADDVAIIDKKPETEYRELGGLGHYVQADIREPLPDMAPGEYVQVGRVLRYLFSEHGHLSEDEINIPIIENASRNLLALMAQECRVEIVDHLAVTTPAVAVLCAAGFRLTEIYFEAYADEDLPAEYSVVLERK